MNRNSFTRTCLLALALSTAISTAHAGTAVMLEPGASVASVMGNTILEVRDLVRHQDFIANALAVIAAEGGETAPLSKVVEDLGAHAMAASRLQRANRSLRAVKGLPEQGADLLQVRLLLPEGTGRDDFALSAYRVAAVPLGEDRLDTMVSTYAADGSMQEIGIDARPAFPLLLVEVDTRTALREGMKVVNEGLRAAGLQTLPAQAAQADTLDITRLDRIRLAVDQEPNLKGAAEIFAIVSGLQVDEKKPEMRTFDMPWLDHDKTDYYPSQPWILWGNYRYDVANVQLFEEDGETNYKTMLSALIKVVGATIGPIQPSVGLVSVIADAVLTVMPDAWFVDEHDYVDSFYLLQRGQAYTSRPGAGANATVDLTPITLGK